MHQQNQPQGMIPIQVNFDNDPPKHVLTIKPGNNGWAVFVEEDIKLKRSVNMKELKQNIGEITDTLNAHANDSDVAKIYRENDKKFDPNEPPKIALGMYIFKKIEDLLAFITFVYENQIQEMEKAEQDAKLAAEKLTPKFNSQMQGKQ